MSYKPFTGLVSELNTHNNWIESFEQFLIENKESKDSSIRHLITYVEAVNRVVRKNFKFCLNFDFILNFCVVEEED